MDFGEVLRRAFQIIWRHKVLWIFGILAGCADASGGPSSNLQATFDAGAPPPQLERFFADLPPGVIPLLIGGFVLAVLLLVVLAIFLGTIGRVGLIRGTLLAEEGTERLAFGELFRGSLPYFWRVFGLSLVVGLAVVVLVLLLFIPFAFLAIVTLGIGLLCLIPLICVLVPLGWFLWVIVEQASIAIVVEDRNIVTGWQRGWEVVRHNLGPIILMALILFLGVGLLGGFLIGWPIALLLAPLFAFLIFGGERAIGIGLPVIVLCFVAYLPVFLVLNGILRGYTGSAWTLTFLRLTRRPVVPETVEF
jgi:hypothetical protein